ncbi:hypothetical protein JW916_16830 [Candidatus Sumerlaeota bacterium]|nr:hypothetical protein [Candidatus Sumerlaeota bacterium]
MEESPGNRAAIEKEPSTKRKSRFGLVGVIVGIVSPSAAVLCLWLGPIHPPPPIDEVVAEKAVGIRDAIAAFQFFILSIVALAVLLVLALLFYVKEWFRCRPVSPGFLSPETRSFPKNSD